MAPDLRSHKHTYCSCQDPDGCPECRCENCGRWLLMYEETYCLICKDKLEDADGSKA